MASIVDLQVDFLASLSKFEERKDNLRRIDLEEGYLDKCVEESKKCLLEIQKIRYAHLEFTTKGGKGKKADFWQQVEIERCRHDPIYWINYWCYILNPWLTKYGFPMKLPFVLFPKQVDYIKWKEDLYKKNKSGVVYKCRDVGVSWLNVADQAWHWSFEFGFQGRFGSLKAEEVDDKNDPDSLFQKLRVIIYSLPLWMRPKEFSSEGGKHDTLMKMYNPVTKSTISGQQGDNMGRGGRASLYDVDEWAKVTHDKKVEAALASNTPCRIYTSTPAGRDNDFAEKVEGGKLPVFSFDYWDDPRKSKDWLANYSETQPEDVVKQEVLKSFDAFKFGTAIPSEWVNAAIALHDRISSGQISYEGTVTNAALDVAAGGSNRSVLLWRKGILVEGAEEWDLGNTTLLTRTVGTRAEELDTDTLAYDPISVGIGVKSTFELEEFKFRAIPVDFRGGASEVPLEGDTKPARERCMNRRAELMERLRIRFERTFEYITQKTDHPLEKLIAIPKIPKLRSQLSLPERFQRNGKVRLEAKEDMVKRGIESPDYFDAILISEANEIGDIHVVQAFNPKVQGLLIEDDLPLKALVSRPDVQNYVSVYHTKSLSAGGVGALWFGVSKRLMVYGEFDIDNGTVPMAVSKIRAEFPTNVYEFVGNKEMFSKDNDDLFMQYLDNGILMNENFMYNELSSVALLNEMFEHGRIKMSKKCTKLSQQLDGFVRKKGSPDLTGMNVAMSLCNLISRLKEFGKVESKVIERPHYTRTTGKRVHAIS